jgi:hypothetical protein
MDQVVPLERKKHVHRLLGMERKEKRNAPPEMLLHRRL